MYAGLFSSNPPPPPPPSTGGGSRAVARDLAAATAFAWAGGIAAIGMEAAVKFKAPNLSRAVGLEVGQIVFAAFHKAQAGGAGLLAATLCGAFVVASNRDRAAGVVLPLGERLAAVPLPVVGGAGVALGALAVQHFYLFPLLSERAAAASHATPLPPSQVHVAYMGLEAAKLAALLGLGWWLLRGTGRGGGSTARALKY
jgi:hypothetical protein